MTSPLIASPPRGEVVSDTDIQQRESVHCTGTNIGKDRLVLSHKNRDVLMANKIISHPSTKPSISPIPFLRLSQVHTIITDIPPQIPKDVFSKRASTPTQCPSDVESLYESTLVVSEDSLRTTPISRRSAARSITDLYSSEESLSDWEQDHDNDNSNRCYEMQRTQWFLNLKVTLVEKRIEATRRRIAENRLIGIIETFPTKERCGSFLRHRPSESFALLL